MHVIVIILLLFTIRQSLFPYSLIFYFLDKIRKDSTFKYDIVGKVLICVYILQH